ncbi:MAG TPA: hypothetical protein VMU50_21365 [Polyangia bacterium]|nr:hypothetical protein [Polyangia bacterium]
MTSARLSTPRPPGTVESTMAVPALGASAATSPTMMSLSPGPQAKISTARVSRPGRAERVARGLWATLSWIAGSIAYIYVYLRGKLDAGERRRRLVTERDGSQRLLAGAFKDLGTAILREGIGAPDLTGLLEAIGRAEARRESALADIAASENMQAAEDGRLGAQESALEAAWRTCDAARAEADELLRPVTAQSQDVAARTARVRESLATHERDAQVAAAQPDGAARAAHLRHEAAALSSELGALQAQAARLERELVGLRERSASLRAVTAEARNKLEAAVTARRAAAGSMGAGIAGHTREQSEAEREIGELTEQLGRAAAQARVDLREQAPLRPLYQRIDRLKETIGERSTAIAALDQSLAHYDQRKLLTGVGLAAGLVVVTVGVLWVVLR